MKYGFNFTYAFVQTFVKIAIRCNYRKIVYLNKENIPIDSPIIYAPNHRNAVIDGLTLVNVTFKHIVFLARADFFNNKLLANFLYYFYIIPVYRIRDGKENLSKNDDIFEQCGQILEHYSPICLFPEAKHSPKQSLLPIQKGIPRIALPTEALKSFSLNINVVPVAIYYTEIHGFLSDLYVTYCKPIKTVDYKADYEKNPNLAINKMRHDIEYSLTAGMVNITNEAYYHFYEYAIDFSGQDVADKLFPNDRGGLIKANQLIIKELDRLFVEDNPFFLEIVNDYGHAFSILRKNGLNTKDKIFNPEKSLKIIAKFVGLLISFPIALYGIFNTIIPLISYIVFRANTKDDQFISTERTIVATFVIPIIYLIQFIIFGCITHSWLCALGYIISVATTFYFGCYWYKWFLTTIRKYKVRRYVNRHDYDWKAILKMIDWRRYIIGNK